MNDISHKLTGQSLFTLEVFHLCFIITTIITIIIIIIIIIIISKGFLKQLTIKTNSKIKIHDISTALRSLSSELLRIRICIDIYSDKEVKICMK